MTGLAEGWEWTNYPSTNVLMTNWIGIYGSLLTNGATSEQPTLDALGVKFPLAAASSKFGFTNSVPASINVRSNYILTFFINSINTNNVSNFGVYLLSGTNGGATTGNNNLFYALIHDTTDTVDVEGGQGGTGFGPGTKFAQKVYIDLSIFVSNSLNGSGTKIYIYTNGTGMESVTYANAIDASINYLAYGHSTHFSDSQGVGFQGYIEGFYILTNNDPSTVTSSTFSNIHYYRTNYLMHGSSP